MNIKHNVTKFNCVILTNPFKNNSPRLMRADALDSMLFSIKWQHEAHPLNQGPERGSRNITSLKTTLPNKLS
jgi:hypothetical protein